VSQAPAPETASASTVSSQNQTEQQPAAQTSPPEQAKAETAPAKVSSSAGVGVSSRRLWIVGGLLLAALVLMAVAILPALRRGYKFSVPGSSQPEPSAETAVLKARTAPARATSVQGDGLAGGPRQISVQLKPWSPPLRQSASPSPKPGDAFNRLKGSKSKPSRLPVPIESQPDEPASVGEPFFEGVGPVLEQEPEVVPAVAAQETGLDGSEGVTEFAAAFPITPRSAENEILEVPEEPMLAPQETNEFSEHPREEAFVPDEQPNEVVASGSEYAWSPTETLPELIAEPIENDQPQETIFAEREAFVERDNFAERESFAEREAAVTEVAAERVSDSQPPPVIPTRPVFPEPTIPATMPETTQTPPAPIAKAPAPPVPKPQPQPQPPVPAAGMQTSVQLTFSFEIAAMQLTPSFKMGVLKVRPISKLVTMRLPSPQRAQSPLNLQVAFEVVKIQPVAGALGTIRVVPSQQQRPAMGGMPSFAVAGLQVVPNSETAPVQLTPSSQGRASVFITVPFQISTLEFSPTLEIGSVTLNSNSKQVVVQLPGTGPTEGAPMFEIANLELNEGGEIVMMQLNLLGGPKRA